MVEDQRYAARRPDVLVFETEVLDNDLTVAGAIDLDLWFSTTQTAADIVAKLTAYRAGQERGAQSALMYPVAKPMSDNDLDNLAAFISSL